MKSPIRILAVDGGGVGGIIPARILERLDAIGLKVVDRADLVAGTSTGGLIALGLARGLSPGQLCELYQDRVKDIFSSTNRRWLALRSIRAKFAPDGLRAAVHTIVGDLTLGDLRAKHVLIPVTALHRADLSHFPAGVFLSTAYRLTQDDSLEKYASSRWKCVDVALATAAAPTYFPAHVVDDPKPGSQGQWVCWDGGIVANNPGLAAVGEVLRLDLAERNVRVRSEQIAPPDIRVLSLGTGYRNLTVEAGDWGLIQAARPVVTSLLDTSVGSTAFLLRQVLGARAFRASVPLAADYEMDDPTAVDRLNDQAVQFAETGLSAVAQPDGIREDLRDWLTRLWFD
jgi:patatin-like phospholipase/acyl hydrolase